MPGVTRQVSAFRIATNPPLYLVDTPGVMVPRVETATVGLCLALTRAVPDAVVPPDILVGFMLRMVRLRRLFGSRAATTSAKSTASSKEAKDAKNPQQRLRVSKAVEAWLWNAGVEPRHDRGDGDEDNSGVKKNTGMGSHCPPSGEDGVLGSEYYEATTALAPATKVWEDYMEALVKAVERESGAEGKPEAEARRICCRYLLDAFGEGQFGRLTLDSAPRVRQQKPVADFLDVRRDSGGISEVGWAHRVVSRAKAGKEGERLGGAGGLRDCGKSEPGDDLAEILDRDWSSASAWERAEARRT